MRANLKRDVGLAPREASWALKIDLTCVDAWSDERVSRLEAAIDDAIVELSAQGGAHLLAWGVVAPNDARATHAHLLMSCDPAAEDEFGLAALLPIRMDRKVVHGMPVDAIVALVRDHVREVFRAALLARDLTPQDHEPLVGLHTVAPHPHLGSHAASSPHDHARELYIVGHLRRSEARYLCVARCPGRDGGGASAPRDCVRSDRGCRYEFLQPETAPSGRVW